MQAYIALEDGSVFEGVSFGAQKEAVGEVVFNTSLTGYQEILTDPSYRGQIVVMTNPLIGNYGINEEDVESRSLSIAGFVVKELSRVTSNWRSSLDLSTYLEQNGVPGIQGVDTREMTRRIRDRGALKGVIATGAHDPKLLVEKARSSPGIEGRDLVKEVTCTEIWQWKGKEPVFDTGPRRRIVVFDFGVKYSILRELEDRNCDVTVVPATTSAETIKQLDPAGIVLSNGPGDPFALPHIVAEIKALLGYRPMLAICLGHQIVCQALGAKTHKLKFGHHGGNHPVLDRQNKTVGITSQNHGFCVDTSTINGEEVEIIFHNLNDGTNEGIRHRRYPLLSVQFHPEASPGPHDTQFLFEQFIDMMKDNDAQTV